MCAVRARADCMDPGACMWPSRASIRHRLFLSCPVVLLFFLCLRQTNLDVHQVALPAGPEQTKRSLFLSILTLLSPFSLCASPLCPPHAHQFDWLGFTLCLAMLCYASVELSLLLYYSVSFCSWVWCMSSILESTGGGWIIFCLCLCSLVTASCARSPGLSLFHEH